MDTRIRRSETVGDQFARVVVHGDIVYVAGLVASDLDADFPGQVREVLSKLDVLLEKAGSHKSALIRVIVYLKDFVNYATFKAEYAEWIDQENLPARATLRADMWDPRLMIEIIATAAVVERQD